MQLTKLADSVSCKENVRANNKSAKLSSYKALVQPVMEYTSLFWDPHTSEGTNDIEKV